MFRWLSGARPDVASLGLWQVLERRGLRAAANRDPHLLAQALERCTTCRASVACGKQVAAGRDDKLVDFCPNARILAHLEAMERHAPKRDLL